VLTLQAVKLSQPLADAQSQSARHSHWSQVHEPPTQQAHPDSHTPQGQTAALGLTSPEPGRSAIDVPAPPTIIANTTENVLNIVWFSLVKFISQN